MAGPISQMKGGEMIHKMATTGLLLILFFVCLPLYFMKHRVRKQYAIIIWVFASVTASMFYPSAFYTWFGVDLAILIVLLIHIIMFRLGTALNMKNFERVFKMSVPVFIGLLFVVFTACNSPGNENLNKIEDRPPNILFILTDDQRWDNLGYSGNMVIHTPVMDSLASSGTYFQNAFVTTSICATSRASILTGQYAHSHGAWDFNTEIDLEKTYPWLMKEAGYYTGFMGKWGVSAQDRSYLLKAADMFDFWAGNMGQSRFWHSRDCNYVQNNGTTEKFDFFCDCGGRSGPEGRVHQETYVFPEKVKSFLDQRDPTKPFCLSLSYKSPHMPWTEYDTIFNDYYKDDVLPVVSSMSMDALMKKPDFLRYSLNHSSKNYKMLHHVHEKDGLFQNWMKGAYRLVTGVDYSIGVILKELKKRGLSDNTIVIFYSDNGHFFNEHGFHGKWLMYEESIRVPGFIYDPRNKTNGSRSGELVLNIDLAPTMLEYAGIKVPDYMEGESLLPVINDPHKPLREDFFYEHHFRFRSGADHIERSEGVRGRVWSYINYIDQAGPRAEELYNIIEDPLNMHDLSTNPAYSDILDQMRERFKQYRSGFNPTGRQ